MYIQNLKAQDSSMTETRLELLLRNLLGPIFNLLIIYSQWWKRSLREKQVYHIDHYLGKDTVNNILATRFKQYSIGTTLEQELHRGGSDL